ncbi:MAG TPA: ShlB/FhaC/HecB family hemolysin secretion/activation protein, partial [Verrucomicrobiae bacterium]|nr:ShlB/FhaC/HecB family hemolysin secretion/activation protein [Verrucomicrobiae bacterium]
MRETSTARHGTVRTGQLFVLLLLMFSGLALNAQVLPPLPPAAAGTNRLPAMARLFVREFQFEGNRAFTATELAKVTAPFTNRELSSEDLEEARRAVTLQYVNHGYINSGAIIPDQDPRDGVILLRIVEGELSKITLSGNKWLRDGYIINRVARWAGPPLDMGELQEGLQLLRQNPNVKQINAELKPGTAPGESVLDLKVTDEQPFRLGLQVDNQRPPSVGAYQIWLQMADVNLTGHSDPLTFNYGIANAGEDGPEFSGVDNLEGSYLLPFTPMDTTIGLHGSRLNTSIIEDQFTALDITSLTRSLGVFLRQPVYQNLTGELAFTLGFDWRQNETWLLGEPFSVSPGAVNGKMNVSVLRFSQEWLHRGQNHVLALRSTFNFGLDLLDATDDGIPGNPDGEFFSWLGQGQYIQRLFNTQNQFVFRLTGQWSSEPLLALEQFSVGGMATVRGYLENQLVRDKGIVLSVEFRIPVVYNKAGAGIVQIAPFFDYGGAWNVEGSPDPTSIYSVGAGLLVNPSRHFS